MLNLKNITKIYKTSSLEQKALDDVSISFIYILICTIFHY